MRPKEPRRAHDRLQSLAQHLGQRKPPPPAATRRMRMPLATTTVSPTSAKEMSWEELYQLDTVGYLRVENCIDRPTIHAAWDATERVIERFGKGREPLSIWQDAGYGDKYRNAHLFDPLLQRLAYDPRILGYACQLLNNQPRLVSGTMMNQHHGHSEHGFHGQKEVARYRVEDAPRFYSNPLTHSIFCDLFTCFLYLTDVQTGDGGLAIIPGSHHSTFPYPNSNGSGSGVGYSLSDKEVLTVECNAGDLVIMPLRTVHAAHVWKPIDRDRRMIFYTFAPQDVFADEGGSVDDTLAQCAAAGVELDIDPLTQELMATKKKGLSQQLKPLVARMIDEGQLNQAVDRANSWE